MTATISAPHAPNPALVRRGRPRRLGPVTSALLSLPVGKAVTLTDETIDLLVLKRRAWSYANYAVRIGGGKFSCVVAGPHSIQITRTEAAKPTLKTAAA